VAGAFFLSPYRCPLPPHDKNREGGTHSLSTSNPRHQILPIHMVKLNFFKESVHEGKLPPVYEFRPLNMLDSFRFCPLNMLDFGIDVLLAAMARHMPPGSRRPNPRLNGRLRPLLFSLRRLCLQHPFHQVKTTTLPFLTANCALLCLWSTHYCI
jgi:hypothetical protein